ncbi:MAG: hypothetical protein ACXW3L_09630, partial [Limisphaerales bacterium]
LLLSSVILIASSAGCATTGGADERKSNSRQLAREMIGTWVMVGTPGGISEAPEKGGRFKYRTGTHWIVFSVDPENGHVTETFGGKYTMRGDQYVETQEFADYQWLRDNGASFRFQVKVEGDFMTQLGIGNPYNEVWKRVKLTTPAHN